MSENSSQLSRSDFLRASALGAVGLGVAGVASSCSAKSEATDARRGYVVTVTHGPDDPDRVMLALFTATRLPEGDNHVWFAIDGGQVAKKDEAEKVTSPLFEKQGNAARLLEELQAKGTAVHI